MTDVKPFRRQLKEKTGEMRAIRLQRPLQYSRKELSIPPKSAVMGDDGICLLLTGRTATFDKNMPDAPSKDRLPCQFDSLHKMRCSGADHHRKFQQEKAGDALPSTVTARNKFANFIAADREHQWYFNINATRVSMFIDLFESSLDL